MKSFLTAILIILICGCSTNYPNKTPVSQAFPQVTGNNLEKQEIELPQYFLGTTTILLLGYKQDSQFDIDRWLIGLDMTQVTTPVYEIPTIQGMFPRMFSTVIDNGMRKGIPKSLWQGVITVYQGGDKIQQFTGNMSPNNARVILLDKSGTVIFFYDEGFSVDALNKLRSAIDEQKVISS